MTIRAMWIEVLCNGCGKEVEVELETDFNKSGSWPVNTDRLYQHLENWGWGWQVSLCPKTGRGIDLCPSCWEKSSVAAKAVSKQVFNAQ